MALSAALLLAPAPLARSHGQAPATPPRASAALAIVHDGGNGWSAARIGQGDAAVDAYFVHDSRPKPVVILLQGSGCLPAATIDADGPYHPTSVFQDAVTPSLDRVHVAIVEKRGVSPLAFRPGMPPSQQAAAFAQAGTHCTEAFHRHATKAARVDDVRALMDALAAQPWAAGFILAGHSEGTHVATGVLRAFPARPIIAAGLFASAGPTPLWGGQYASDPQTSRQQFQRNLERLQMLQQASDDAMIDDLPGRRWKTFWIQSTPLDDVRDSGVPLFVAQGSRDGTVMPADLFVMEAVRRNPRRPVRYVVLENGDHAFETSPGQSRIVELFRDFLGWALAADRRTGTAVLK